MQFQVSFYQNNGYAFQVNYSSVGTGRIDLIRQTLGVMLSLDRIQERVDSMSMDPKIDISEGVARASPLFTDKALVTVCTPAKFLNKYAIDRVGVQTDKETGEVKKAWVYVDVDREEILKDWIEAGYPLDWGWIEGSPAMADSTEENEA